MTQQELTEKINAIVDETINKEHITLLCYYTKTRFKKIGFGFINNEGKIKRINNILRTIPKYIDISEIKYVELMNE